MSEGLEERVQYKSWAISLEFSHWQTQKRAGPTTTPDVAISRALPMAVSFNCLFAKIVMLRMWWWDSCSWYLLKTTGRFLLRGGLSGR